MVAQRRKPEDTADGCRSLAQADPERAAAMPNAHMRGSLERSADRWSDRASLLDRLEATASARALSRAADELDGENGDGQGTGSIEQGKAQAQDERGQEGQGARPRIKGLSAVADRKDEDAD
jgi:hypothetical protein